MMILTESLRIFILKQKLHYSYKKERVFRKICRKKAYSLQGSELVCLRGMDPCVKGFAWGSKRVENTVLKLVLDLFLILSWQKVFQMSLRRNLVSDSILSACVLHADHGREFQSSTKTQFQLFYLLSAI